MGREVLARTSRLILRNWSEADIDPYFAMVADPEVMKFIGNGEPRGRDYAETFVRRMMQLFDERGWIRFAVEDAESGELVGFCGYDLDGERLDFGWRYARKFWGKGIGGEAALAALDIGRKRFELRDIRGISYPENVGSIKIFDKLGMTYLHDETADDGRRIVHYGYPDEIADD